MSVFSSIFDVSVQQWASFVCVKFAVSKQCKRDLQPLFRVDDIVDIPTSALHSKSASDVVTASQLQIGINQPFPVRNHSSCYLTHFDQPTTKAR